jgi:hypothetical protein
MTRTPVKPSPEQDKPRQLIPLGPVGHKSAFLTGATTLGTMTINESLLSGPSTSL